MTNPHLVLKNVSHVLSDGRTLFSGLHEQFDMRSTGLVGRNGVGKTLLARILAGLLQPTTGHCQRSGSVHYLAQQVVHPDGSTVAELAGVKHTLDALARIGSGSTAPEDFDAVGDHWDIHQRLRYELERNNLSHLETDTPASILSGGEAMRISLIGAMLSDADFLILDEPSNHLDRPNRKALIKQLQRWPRGLIVISHDRQLLKSMERIVELSSLGLQSYGGNYSFYAEAKAHERQNALQNLSERKLERQRQEQAMRKQRVRQEQRQARGNRRGKEANQAKILLDRQKERSETSSGALRQKQASSRAQLNQRVREASQQVEDEPQITLHEIPTKQAAKRRVAELNDVVLPYVSGASQTINLVLGGTQRIGVVGPNGCGKSTLLKVISGLVSPLAGVSKVTSESAYLDQRLENLNPESTVLEQLRLANRTADDGDLRMRLAQLGLDAQKVVIPSGSLSGGERLKGALACILYADSPPQLLLLDEPNNHLDLPSVQALELMLRSYHGTLIVVSHDDTFLENLELTDRLLATENGWSLEPL
ncbi:ABC-F family ATP-binding cassette domain-containing protein [Marinobacter nauticus]|uniref:ABC-F family ATP-binding cassette domain-containing protein n=1 Tax=Marinobacter nauticus TaxID=2743 RepID=UPI001C952FB0|nr:ABC-F family ATP-binding cassette domain-containing protein [Marinobacter nauticus]MBY6221735.1 ATP-binding cassette domain-containing protein [Marinobacter nauticus]